MRHDGSGTITKITSKQVERTSRVGNRVDTVIITEEGSTIEMTLTPSSTYYVEYIHIM